MMRPAAGHRVGSAWRPGRGVAAGLLALFALAGGPAQAEPGEVESCMECHEDAEDEFLELADGSKLAIGIDAKAWGKSVHAGEVGCTDCHRGITEHPHPDVTERTPRDYQVVQSATCKRCHYAHYTRTLDGIHYAQLQEGNAKAPTCVDCHGSHYIANPSQPRISVDKACAKCHGDISKAYERSVHGKALHEDAANVDVPVCTDCHGAHGIRDARQAGFRAASHQICARCHSDADRMDPYDLNTEVVSTYLADFHGQSNALYAMGAGEPGQPMATCTDCHGIHDIPSFKEVSPAVVRERVVKVCQGCHEDVPEGFADAWLSHYPPTLASAPLVWAVTWFYRIIIPFILLGLVLHILLDLWRVRVTRRGGES